MRIAIIGSGIAGLSAAWHLGGSHDVTVFESANRPGGHAWSVDLDGEAVDLGFMVYNTVTYPGITQLFSALDVHSRESTMSFAVRSSAAEFEYQGSSLNGFFARRRSLLSLRHWNMLRGIMRFNRVAARQLEHDRSGIEGSFGEWCEVNRIGKAVRERFLRPIGSAMWSCSTRAFDDFPAVFVLGFMGNHRMLQLRGRPVWRTVVGSSRAYVESMLAASRFTLHCDHAVQRVTRASSGAKVQCAGRDPMHFDHVVLACHADQAIELVEGADETELQLLSQFPYTANDVVLHRDESLLPRRDRARASWNYLLDEGGSSSIITYDLRRLQGLRSSAPVLVTLNGTDRIKPEAILQRHVMRHPAYAAGAYDAQQRHEALIDRDGLSYCGAYWGWGFHEDGFASGKRVADVLCSEDAAT
ncbi:MAG: FAD-dependent oxidoreductase [Phycisphaerales bacterium]|nr:FAD-dependent oxidoreductase [Phycisphaerales bacterium]